MSFDLHLYCVGTLEQQRFQAVFWFSAQAAQNCSVVLFLQFDCLWALSPDWDE